MYELPQQLYTACRLFFNNKIFFFIFVLFSSPNLDDKLGINNRVLMLITMHTNTTDQWNLHSCM